MPLVSRTFDQLISFTRTSAATYVNSAGNIVTPPASKNLLTFTEEFDNGTWGKSNSTVTANSVAAPDGLMTADTLVESAATANHVASAGATLTAVAHVFSIHLKKGSGATAPDWVQLYTGGTSTQYANFNLSTGATGNVAAGSTASITPLGGGWYRCSLTFTPGASGAASVAIAFTNNADTTTRGPSYAGAVTSDVFIWGAQLEVGSTATSYVRNFGGLFPPRFDYDPVTLQPRGLLIEEQRTNLLLRSEEFDNASWGKTRSSVTANAATSPDGTVDADKLVEDTTATQSHVTSQTTTIVAATTYTASVYLKAAERTFARVLVGDSGGNNGVRVDVNLSDGTVSTGTNGTGWTLISGSTTAVGNGWYRVTVTGTSAANTTGNFIIYMMTTMGTIAYTGDGTSGIFLWGAQLEAGSFATSYIPTVASQVTRTADQVSIVAPNFAPWYNQSEGTFVVEWRIANANVSTGRYSVKATSPTVPQGLGVWTNTNSIETRGWVGATSIIAGNASLSAINKAALAYKATDNAISLNGAAAVASSATGPTDANSLEIGGSSGATSQINGHIRRISYYPSRLSDAQLQALSA